MYQSIREKHEGEGNAMTKVRNFWVGSCHLVSHRARDEKPIFEEKIIAARAVGEIRRLSTKAGLPVLAYCFAKDRVLLLFGPLEDPTAISNFMKRLTRFMTDIHNRHHRVPGSPWRERFQVWPVRPTAEQIVMRYIDRYPVREGCVRSVHLYPYSSYADRKSNVNESWLACPNTRQHQCLDYKECLAQYFDFVGIGPDKAAINMIETAMLHDGSIIGDARHIPPSAPDPGFGFR